MRSAFHPLLGRFRIGASRLRPLSPKLHTSDCSSACPGSSTWVDKVPSRDTPSLNLADHREGVFPGDPQVARQRLALDWRRAHGDEVVPSAVVADSRSLRSASTAWTRGIDGGKLGKG